jgi:hypothetical protein
MVYSTTHLSEKIHNWCQELKVNGDRVDLILAKAAQWGANQMLGACLDIIREAYSDRAATGDPQLIDKHVLVKQLRAILAPKPLPTKDEARNLLDAGIYHNLTMHEKQEAYNKLRALIDSLPDD